MRTALSLTLALLSFVSASAITIEDNVADCLGQPYPIESVTLKPLSFPTIGPARLYLPGTRGTGVTNGVFKLQNVVGSLYDLQFEDAATIRIAVPSNDTNTYNVAQLAFLATNLFSFEFNTNLNVFTYTYRATNTPWPITWHVRAGDNVILTTNNPGSFSEYVTISSAGGPTNGITASLATNIAAYVAGSSVTASNTGLPESFYLSAGAVPPMGWHSWGTQLRTNLWATNILASIDGLYTNGLVQYGWNWVEIDDNVFTSTNAEGLLVPDPVHWPDGIKSVVDYAHERGIKVMLYSELGMWTDGILQQKNPDGSWVRPSYGTRDKHVENGHQFASWGIDGVWTHGDWTANSTPEQSYKRMVEYYRAVSTNRPIYFLSIHSKHKPWGDMERLENSGNWSCWYPATGISQDIASDMLAGMEMLIDIAAQPHVSKTIRPGHHVFFGVYPLLINQLKMGFGGAAMFASPMMITTWPSEWKILSSGIHQIMTNADFISIHQDPACKPAVKVLDMPTLSYDWIKAGYIPVNPNATNVLSAVTNSVWYRPLSTPGSFAVFLLNRGSNTANIYFSRTNFPVAPTAYKMFDVWARTNMADLTNQTVTVAVPSNSISIYRLSLPPSVTATVADADISIPLILENPVADNGGGNAWVFQITNSANATGMKMGQVMGNQGWHGIQLWNGPQFGYDTCSLLGTTNQTAFGIPDTNSLFTWRARTTIIASMKGNGAMYANGIGITNIPIAGVVGLPAALTWLTNNTGGGGTGAVSSVNGLTGVVTLGAADVGAQPALGFAPQYGTENGTNWAQISTNIIGDLRQEIADTTLDFVPQYGTAGLTNLANEITTSGGGFSATNLTSGTIDAARLPPSVTNSITGGISLSNQTAIYMLSITTNTTLSAFGNVHASEFRTASLWITNGTTNTYTLALPAGTSCPDGTTLYVTNGQRRVVSIGGLLNFTNAVSRALP